MVVEKNQEKKMIITPRDHLILKFVNDFGFCEMLQIKHFFKLRRSNCYRILKRLVDKKLLSHDRIYHGEHGVYRLAKEAKSCISDLPPLKEIVMGNYEHHLCVLKVFLKLNELYSEANWITERHLIADKCHDGLGSKDHVPDGILVFADSKHVAIEVELTFKGQKRTTKIINDYGANSAIQEVWYFCSHEVLRSLKLLVNDYPMFKVYDVEVFLR